MMKLMGFAGFDTTKGKGVEDNKRGPAKGAVSKHKEREYRQYMNRRGTCLWNPVRYPFQRSHSCGWRPVTRLVLC